MQVILTEDVVGLGDIGQTVEVKKGFARNFLIPQKKAFEVGSVSAKEIEHKMLHVNAKKKKLRLEAESFSSKLSGLTLETGLKVGEGGKVFGSVTSRDLSSLLKDKGFKIERKRILLTEPIKKVGEHEVLVKLHADVKVSIKVVVNELSASKKEQEEEVLEVKENLEKEKEDVDTDVEE